MLLQKQLGLCPSSALNHPVILHLSQGRSQRPHLLREPRFVLIRYSEAGRHRNDYHEQRSFILTDFLDTGGTPHRATGKAPGLVQMQGEQGKGEPEPLLWFLQEGTGKVGKPV